MSTIEIIAAIAAAASAIGGGAWGVMRVIGVIVAKVVEQFNANLDERFKALERAREEGRKVWDERFRRLEAKQDETERDVRRILIELPREYVRREDHIRFETVINAKLDAVAARVDLVLERQQKG